jgi:hypothetical protein
MSTNDRRGIRQVLENFRLMECGRRGPKSAPADFVEGAAENMGLMDGVLALRQRFLDAL